MEVEDGVVVCGSWRSAEQRAALARTLDAGGHPGMTAQAVCEDGMVAVEEEGRAGRARTLGAGGASA